MDYHDVCRALSGLSRPELIQLGTALGLSEKRLQEMIYLPEEVVDAWLFKEDDVLKVSGEPTWSSLSATLKRTVPDDSYEKFEANCIVHQSGFIYERGNQPLEMADHYDICQELKCLSNEKLIRLGGALGLSYPKLKKMTSLPEEMVAAWLSKEDNVLQRTGQPTWSNLQYSLIRIHSGLWLEMKESAQLLKDEPPFLTILGQPLGMIDHHDVCQELKDLSEKELIHLGGALGLLYPRLKQMTPLPEEMVAAWLSKEDNVLKRTGQPTWRSLADALKRIGCVDIAVKIQTEIVEMGSRKESAQLLKDEPPFLTILGQPLGMIDHHDVCQELKDLSKKELISLGGALGLSYPRLKQMTPLSEEMVAAWLSKEDNVLKRTGQPTWRSLTDALKRNGHADLAEEIMTKRKMEQQSRKGLAMIWRTILNLLAVAATAMLIFIGVVVAAFALLVFSSGVLHSAELDLSSIEIINQSEISNTAMLPYLPEVNFIHFVTQAMNQSEVIQTIDLQEFGLKLHFQPNTSLESFNITIGVSMCANYTPPEGTTLVSAIYFIHTSSQLLRPVTVEIEHCVDIDWDQPDSNRTLTFGKASTHNLTIVPYVFKTLSGGNFSRNFWGTIELSNFSAVGIFSEGENSSIDYIAYLLSLRHKGKHGIYHVALLTSHNLNAIEEVLKKDFGDWVRIMNPFSFIFLNENKELILNITREGIKTGNWNIKPKLLPPKISKSAIDYHGLERYELKVSWMSDEEEKLLEYFMDVDGISRESFLIFIDPYELPETTSNNFVSSEALRNRKHLEQTEIRDFMQLYSAVADIGDWEGLCLSLRVDDTTMNVLEYSSEDDRVKKRRCLRAYWNTGKANWEDVVRAVVNYPIINKRVAKEIVERYKLSSDILGSTDELFCKNSQCT